MKSNSEYMESLSSAMKSADKAHSNIKKHYDAIMKIYGELLYQNTYGATMELFHEFDGKTRTREHLSKMRKQAESLAKKCAELVKTIDDMPEKPSIS